MIDKQVMVSLELLEDLVDSGACWYDYNGLCQAHMLQEFPCPQAILKDIILNAQFDGDPIAGLQKIRDELEEAE